MSLSLMAGVAVLGVVVGVLSGVIGIGGGAFLVPALVLLFGMSQLDAQGTSLATLLLPIGIFAFLAYYRAGHVDLKMAGLLSVGFAAGGWLGGMWAQHLPALVLRRGFAVTLIAIAVRMLWMK